jgi:hypothetical protein
MRCGSRVLGRVLLLRLLCSLYVMLGKTPFRQPSARRAAIRSPALARRIVSLCSLTLAQKHKVRIKSTDGWCDPHTRSYSGYLSVNHGREMWFTFFESRNDPKNDPVVMWINGESNLSPTCSRPLVLGRSPVADARLQADQAAPQQWASSWSSARARSPSTQRA